MASQDLRDSVSLWGGWECLLSSYQERTQLSAIKQSLIKFIKPSCCAWDRWERLFGMERGIPSQATS